MLMPRLFSLHIVVFAMLCLIAPVRAEVLMWEEDVPMPTYLIGPPEEMPMFYSGRAYQGAQNRVYPYPLMADIKHEKQPRVHRMVYLENEYVKVALMPGAAGGGRIFSAVDKTTGYDFFYRQTVVKPGLISTLGAWYSGGIEWNFPHHHRTTTYLPTDYRMEANPDGSKTVWMGEVEMRHRMKWMVGVTLRPGSSHVEVSGRLYNRTPMVNSFLFWANVAVHVDSSYQIIFPPNQQWGTSHGKNAFTRWPFSAGSRVMGYDGYKAGDDLSWWKTHRSPVSIFAHNSTKDFLAGYNHDRNAGVVHVAERRIVPGKKLWTWGTGEDGRMWDNVLTDEDGPYIELMVGAYSDNQPDYSWIQPYETKTFTMTWWPLSGIGGVKNATLEAAVNLEPAGKGKARVAFNSSSKYPFARVMVNADKRVLLDETTGVAPDMPFSREIDLPSGVEVKDLEATLFDAEGRPLVSYREIPEEKLPEPEVVTPPPAPAEIATIEELYLAGQRLEQFHSAVIAPEPYYEEALRRDSLDYRSNTALGILEVRRGMFEQARLHLERAVKRVTAGHTRPRDGEALYYLGLARRALGDLEGASNALFDASWSAAFHAQSFFELARIAAWRGEYVDALSFLERSLSVNLLNNRASCLKAALLRRTGRPDQAVEVARSLLERDPLEHWAASELVLALEQTGQSARAQAARDSLRILMRDSHQVYLELAADYGGCGLWDEAIQALHSLLESDNAFAAYNSLGVSDAPSLTDGSKAMAWYYLGYGRKMSGDKEGARQCYVTAGKQSPRLVFPFRMESAIILRDAMAELPGDPMPRYYLGNLLFDNQPEAALALWEEASRLGGDFATLHRNLGMAQDRVRNDQQQAIDCLERAHRLDPRSAQIMIELDQLYEKTNSDPAKRLAMIEQYQETTDRNDGLLARETALYVRLGKYDRAIELLGDHTFAIWEGGGGIHDVWVDALIRRGRERLRNSRHEAALEDFGLAMTWPVNLAVGRPLDGGREPEVRYYIGKTLDAMGQKDKAGEEYRLAVAAERPPVSELSYHQGLAFRELGDNDKAEKIFSGLASTGRRLLQGQHESDFFTKFGRRRSQRQMLAEAHYLVGLGELGKGNESEARKQFSLALEQDINHPGAAHRLEEFGQGR